jgi:hypothetical protein
MSKGPDFSKPPHDSAMVLPVLDNWGDQPLVKYALDCASLGWNVFPLIRGDKKPLRRHSFKTSTTDATLIRECWHEEPKANVGIATGESGLVVIDLDVNKTHEEPPWPWNEPGITDGADVFATIAAEHGEWFPIDTFTVATPSGGWHLYYTSNEEIRNAAPLTGLWRVDVRAQGGYVVAPGSVLPNGRYEVINPVEVSPLPGWLLDLVVKAKPLATQTGFVPSIARRRGYGEAALQNELAKVSDAKPGSRNHTLNAAAFSLGRLIASRDLGSERTIQALRDAAKRVGLPEDEAFATIRSGLTSGMKTSRGAA